MILENNKNGGFFYEMIFSRSPQVTLYYIS